MILNVHAHILFRRVFRYVLKSVKSAFSEHDLIHVSESFPELLIERSGIKINFKLLFISKFLQLFDKYFFDKILSEGAK